MENTPTEETPKPVKAYLFTSQIDDDKTLAYYPVEIVKIENHITATIRYPNGDEIGMPLSRLFPRTRDSVKLFKKLMSRQARIINTTKKFNKQLQDLWAEKQPFHEEVMENLQKNLTPDPQ